MFKYRPVVCVDPIFQRSDADCGLASLAMTLGVPYREVCLTATKMNKKFISEGVWLKELVAIAHEFGVKLTYRPVSDYTEVNGILAVAQGVSAKRGTKRTKRQRESDHCVTVFSSVIFDPSSGLAWEPSSYWAFTKRRPTRFLVVEEE
jgi:hypothetical protein